MSRSTRKFVLDTQLFIQAFRNQQANEALQEFHRNFSPFEYLSVVVAQELRAGIKRPGDRKRLEDNVLGIFDRAGRIITPSESAWHRAGDVLAEMARNLVLVMRGTESNWERDPLLNDPQVQAALVEDMR